VAVAAVGLAVALPFVAALGWDGCSHRSQYISELGARGAPDGAAVSVAFLVVGVLFAAWAALTAPRVAPAVGVARGGHRGRRPHGSPLTCPPPVQPREAHPGGGPLYCYKGQPSSAVMISQNRVKSLSACGCGPLLTMTSEEICSSVARS
jgi:Protein of unknown function (DUF998)